LSSRVAAVVQAFLLAAVRVVLERAQDYQLQQEPITPLLLVPVEPQAQAVLARPLMAAKATIQHLVLSLQPEAA
jgi:hypothetical protein